jgi:hypothetical protein
MTEVPDTIADYARRLLLRETRDQNDIVGAMERACRALQDRLAPLLGLGAFEALMARAVVLAGRKFAFLNGTTMGANCSADRLRQVALEHGQKEVMDAVAAMLANFLWLLVTFTGESIGLRIAQEIWPTVALKSPGSLSLTTKERKER